MSASYSCREDWGIINNSETERSGDYFSALDYTLKFKSCESETVEKLHGVFCNFRCLSENSLKAFENWLVVFGYVNK